MTHSHPGHQTTERLGPAGFGGKLNSYRHMRLGFDLDGTVADLQGALAREAERLFPGIDVRALPRSADPGEKPQTGVAAPGTESEEGESRGALGALTSRQHRALWKAVGARENFWETLDEIEPGALARLFRLVQDRRWELIFLTSRPETDGHTAQYQSYRWLVSRGYESPSVFVVHGSRGKIAASLHLDVLVDDRPENCLDVAIDSTARAILVWRGEEDKVPVSARQLGIGAVGSMSQCLEMLESLDQAEDQVSMLDRLKRLLGLKPQGRSTAGSVPQTDRVGT
jgi:hypothetical protein